MFLRNEVSFGMNIENSLGGIGQGTLEGWRWTVLSGLEGDLVSPVSVLGGTVAATATSVRDGSTRAVLIQSDGGSTVFESETSIVAGAPMTFVVGMVGFGKGGFRLNAQGHRTELDLPQGANRLDIDCVNYAGLVGGSVEVQDYECAALWASDGVEVMPIYKRVTAINENGAAIGQGRDGHPVRLDSGHVFGSPGSAVAISPNGDALVNTSGALSVWRSDGGVEAVPIHGYSRVSAIGWSDSGLILGFGVSQMGAIQHWLYDPRIGLNVLTGQELAPGVVVREVSAIGSNGSVAGQVATATGPRLFRLDPPS